MNTSVMVSHINNHKYNKGHFFSTQGRKVVDYIFGRLVKYNGEFFEKNETISEQTGVSVRTIQRTVKRMQELEMISVAPRRKVCPVTGKTVQSSNLILLLEYKAFKVVNEVIVGATKVVEKVVEVVEAVKEVAKTIAKPFYNKKKAIRVEQTPDWLGQTHVPAEETDEVRAERERLMKELSMFKK